MRHGNARSGVPSRLHSDPEAPGVTPEARKAKTEARLARERIPFLRSLPGIASESATTLRSAEETGIRIACLFGVVGTAFDPDDGVFRDALKKHALWEHLTPREVAFLAAPGCDAQAALDLTWRLEGMFLLMWATELVDDLPLPREETEPGQVVARFPGVDESPWPFIRELRLRPIPEILDAADLLFRLRWATRQAGPERSPPPSGLIPGVVEEWHHAIHWLTCAGDADWDDVRTDP